MSAFDFFEKDEVVSSIENLAAAELEIGKTPIQIVNSIMEAVNYGLSSALYKVKDLKVGESD